MYFGGTQGLASTLATFLVSGRHRSQSVQDVAQMLTNFLVEAVPAAADADVRSDNALGFEFLPKSQIFTNCLASSFPRNLRIVVEVKRDPRSSRRLPLC